MPSIFPSMRRPSQSNLVTPYRENENGARSDPHALGEAPGPGSNKTLAPDGKLNHSGSFSSLSKTIGVVGAGLGMPKSRLPTPLSFSGRRNVTLGPPNALRNVTPDSAGSGPSSASTSAPRRHGRRRSASMPEPLSGRGKKPDKIDTKGKGKDLGLLSPVEIYSPTRDGPPMPTAFSMAAHAGPYGDPKLFPGSGGQLGQAIPSPTATGNGTTDATADTSADISMDTINASIDANIAAIANTSIQSLTSLPPLAESPALPQSADLEPAPAHAAENTPPPQIQAATIPRPPMRPPPVAALPPVPAPQNLTPPPMATPRPGPASQHLTSLAQKREALKALSKNVADPVSPPPNGTPLPPRKSSLGAAAMPTNSPVSPVAFIPEPSIEFDSAFPAFVSSSPARQMAARPRSRTVSDAIPGPRTVSGTAMSPSGMQAPWFAWNDDKASALAPRSARDAELPGTPPESASPTTPTSTGAIAATSPSPRVRQRSRTVSSPYSEPSFSIIGQTDGVQGEDNRHVRKFPATPRLGPVPLPTPSPQALELQHSIPAEKNLKEWAPSRLRKRQGVFKADGGRVRSPLGTYPEPEFQQFPPMPCEVAPSPLSPTREPDAHQAEPAATFRPTERELPSLPVDDTPFEAAVGTVRLPKIDEINSDTSNGLTSDHSQAAESDHTDPEQSPSASKSYRTLAESCNKSLPPSPRTERQSVFSSANMNIVDPSPQDVFSPTPTDQIADGPGLTVKRISRSVARNPSSSEITTPTTALLQKRLSSDRQTAHDALTRLQEMWHDCLSAAPSQNGVCDHPNEGNTPLENLIDHVALEHDLAPHASALKSPIRIRESATSLSYVTDNSSIDELPPAPRIYNETAASSSRIIRCSACGHSPRQHETRSPSPTKTRRRSDHSLGPAESMCSTDWGSDWSSTLDHLPPLRHHLSSDKGAIPRSQLRFDLAAERSASVDPPDSANPPGSGKTTPTRPKRSPMRPAPPRVGGPRHPATAWSPGSHQRNVSELSFETMITRSSPSSSHRRSMSHGATGDFVIVQQTPSPPRLHRRNASREHRRNRDDASSPLGHRRIRSRTVGHPSPGHLPFDPHRDAPTHRKWSSLGSVGSLASDDDSLFHPSSGPLHSTPPGNATASCLDSNGPDRQGDRWMPAERFLPISGHQPNESANTFVTLDSVPSGDSFRPLHPSPLRLATRLTVLAGADSLARSAEENQETQALLEPTDGVLLKTPPPASPLSASPTSAPFATPAFTPSGTPASPLPGCSSASLPLVSAHSEIPSPASPPPESRRSATSPAVERVSPFLTPTAATGREPPVFKLELGHQSPLSIDQDYAEPVSPLLPLSSYAHLDTQSHLSFSKRQSLGSLRVASQDGHLSKSPTVVSLSASPERRTPVPQRVEPFEIKRTAGRDPWLETLPTEIIVMILRHVTIDSMQPLLDSLDGQDDLYFNIAWIAIDVVIRRTWRSGTPSADWRENLLYTVEQDIPPSTVHTEKKCLGKGKDQKAQHYHDLGLDISRARKHWAATTPNSITTVPRMFIIRNDGHTFEFPHCLDQLHFCRMHHRDEIVFVCTNLLKAGRDNPLEFNDTIEEIVLSPEFHAMWNLMSSPQPPEEFSHTLHLLSHLQSLYGISSVYLHIPSLKQCELVLPVPQINRDGTVAWYDVWRIMSILVPLARQAVENNNDIGHVSSALGKLSTTALPRAAPLDPFALSPVWDWADISGRWHVAMVGYPSASEQAELRSYGWVNLEPCERKSIDDELVKYKHSRTDMARYRPSTLDTGLPWSHDNPALYFHGSTKPTSVAQARYYLRGVVRLTTDSPAELRYKIIFRNVDTCVDDLLFEGIQVWRYSSRRGVVGVAFPDLVQRELDPWQVPQWRMQKAERAKTVIKLMPRPAVPEVYPCWFWKPVPGM